MNSNPWAVVQRLIDKALASHCPYGIDDVYVTFSKTDPTARWPGTSWERITDCFLRAADDKHPAGTTGGSWMHKQTYAEVPSQGYVLGYGVNTTAGSPQRTFPAWNWYFEPGTLKQTTTEKTMLSVSPTDFRSNQTAMDITNKYTAANIWRRTA